jgi:hypothetical protein
MIGDQGKGEGSGEGGGGGRGNGTAPGERKEELQSLSGRFGWLYPFSASRLASSLRACRTVPNAVCVAVVEATRSPIHHLKAKCRKPILYVLWAIHDGGWVGGYIALGLVPSLPSGSFLLLFSTGVIKSDGFSVLQNRR